MGLFFPLLPMGTSFLCLLSGTFNSFFTWMNTYYHSLTAKLEAEVPAIGKAAWVMLCWMHLLMGAFWYQTSGVWCQLSLMAEMCHINSCGFSACPSWIGNSLLLTRLPRALPGPYAGVRPTVGSSDVELHFPLCVRIKGTALCRSLERWRCLRCYLKHRVTEWDWFFSLACGSQPFWIVSCYASRAHISGFLQGLLGWTCRNSRHWGCAPELLFQVPSGLRSDSAQVGLSNNGLDTHCS